MKELKCHKCGSDYYVTREKWSQSRSQFKKSGIKYYCSKDCRMKARGYENAQELKCKNCEKPFKKRVSEIKKTKNHFCSRSCSATYNNKNSPKRNLKGSCKSCDTKIASNRKECNDCLIKRKFCGKLKDFRIPRYSAFGFKDISLRDAVFDCSEGQNKYRKIRIQSRKIGLMLFNKCDVCGYDIHIEIAHIKPIKSFSEDSMLSKINATSNLIGLCRNCHWEFDNGFLKFDASGET